MARVACIMMQKDEDLLLEPWILHHGYLFGFENLYVFDNGSTSDVVADVLSRYSAVGVSTFHEHDTPKDFDLKGWIIGNLIQDLQKTRRYDFFMPLDCDEFIGLAGRTGLTVSRNQIHSYLQNRMGINKVLRVVHSLMNVPGSLNVFGIVSHAKSIIPSGQFVGIDHGFHEAELESGKDFIASSLLHFHLHNKPLAKLLQHARDKLVPFVDVEDADALRSFTGTGVHLVHYFFEEPTTYYERLANDVRLEFDGLRTTFELFKLQDVVSAWGEGVPQPTTAMLANIHPTDAFALEDYVQRHPEAVNKTVHPLFHYFLSCRDQRA